MSENMAENRLNDDFEPQKYTYYPEDKSKLSFDEIMYGMRDKLLLKLFYGVIMFLWGFMLIVSNCMMPFLEGVGVMHYIVVNLCIVFLLAMTTVVFLLILRITKMSSCKALLLANTGRYFDIDDDEFFDCLQQDLWKGLRFRSKRMLLTEQYVIGSLDELFLSPIALPISGISEVEYDIYYYGGGSGRRYMKAKFFFHLRNEKTALMYVNYIPGEIIVQMLRYYGFRVSRQSKG